MKIKKLLLKEYKSLIVLVAVIIISAILTAGKTLSFSNLKNLFMQVSIQGIVGLGMTFSLLCAEFDLAVGSVLTASGMVFALCLQSMSLGVSIVVSLFAGAIMGLIDGMIICKMKINSFIATLATSYIFKGIAQMICDGQSIGIRDNAAALTFSKIELFGLPIYFYIFIFLTIVCIYVLSRTRFGRNIYATGGNYEAAKKSGIKVDFYKIMTFVIVGLSAAIAGILLTTRLQSATPIAGDSLNLAVIGAVIIGGTSTYGGVGSVQKSVIGLFIFGVIINTMDVMKVSGYFQQVVRGALTVVIIGLTCYLNHRKDKSMI